MLNEGLRISRLEVEANQACKNQVEPVLECCVFAGGLRDEGPGGGSSVDEVSHLLTLAGP